MLSWISGWQEVPHLLGGRSMSQNQTSLFNDFHIYENHVTINLLFVLCKEKR